MDRQVASFVITYVGYDEHEASCENYVVVNGYYNGKITQTMHRAFNAIVQAHGMLWGLNACYIECIIVEEI